jgi:hypothetical protein
MRILLSAMIAALAAGAAMAAPRGPGNYDGRWSVEVITDRGTCDRVYHGCWVSRVAALWMSARSPSLRAVYPRVAGEYEVCPQQRLCLGDRAAFGGLGQRQLDLADTCLQRTLACRAARLSGAVWCKTQEFCTKRVAAFDLQSSSEKRRSGRSMTMVRSSP